MPCGWLADDLRLHAASALDVSQLALPHYVVRHVLQSHEVLRQTATSRQYYVVSTRSKARLMTDSGTRFAPSNERDSDDAGAAKLNPSMTM